MYVNVAIPVVYKEKNVTLVVTEVYYVPGQRQNFNSEGLPAQVEFITGYAFITESGTEVRCKDVVKAIPQEVLYNSLLKHIMGDSQ